jgi:hypothetical protein
MPAHRVESRPPSGGLRDGLSTYMAGGAASHPSVRVFSLLSCTVGRRLKPRLEAAHAATKSACADWERPALSRTRTAGCLAVTHTWSRRYTSQPQVNPLPLPLPDDGEGDMSLIGGEEPPG